MPERPLTHGHLRRGLRRLVGPRRVARPPPARLFALAALLVATLALATRAEAYVYWTNSKFGPGTIGRANLDGTHVNQSFIPCAYNAFGVAVNAANVYWSNPPGAQIGRANLDGTDADPSFINYTAYVGHPGEAALGVAVNAAHVYWSEISFNSFLGQAGSIIRANLDGSGVDRNFGISASAAPLGVALDGAHVYWANNPTDTIGRADLDGNPASVDQSFITGAHGPDGVAVDAAHVYWINQDTNAVGRANLDGSGADQSFITGLHGSDGVAVDASHVYWANFDTDTIGRANLDGSGADQSFITGAHGPTGVAVDALSLPPPPPSNEFCFGTPKRNEHRGTAKLIMFVPGAGKVKLAKTKKVKGALKRTAAAGVKTLPVKPAGKAMQRLNRKGKAKVKAKVTFTPKGGQANTKSRKLKLRLRKR